MRQHRHLILAFLSLVVFLPGRGAAAVDFQRQIRPILSANCFQCHGPDSEVRMADLRLDIKESALKVVAPAKPADSKLYQRVSSSDPAFRMPPEFSHKTLTAPQIALIRQWIEEGAQWKEHWAYKAPGATPPPAVKNAAWVRNPIDRFILSKLEAKTLQPAAAADRRTLIRRVALDLTGLPPTPAELDLYLKDLSPAAYEHMVDRYLASPHYGEHRARYWLDLARYGDTHGIHIDNFRAIWPYRDWVIQAYNRNLPYDRFGTEQLAGDLLPNATLDQRIATGFIRSGVTTNEAGIIEDEYAEIYAKDRAETVSAAFIGLTVGCATCHDHKFDPITQRDFYSLGAFFRNTTQKVMDDNIPDTPPVVVVPKAEDRDKWEQLQTTLAKLRSDIVETSKAADQDFRQWLATRSKTQLKSPFEDKAQLYEANLPMLARASEAQVKAKTAEDVAARAKTPAAAPPAATVVRESAHLADSDIPGTQALFFGNQGVEIADAPKLDADKPFTIHVAFFYPKGDQGYTIAAHNDSKQKNRGWIIDVSSGVYPRVISARLIGDGGRAIEVKATNLDLLERGTWNDVTVTYDGSRSQSGLALFLNGKAITIQNGGIQTFDVAGDIGVDTPLVLGRSLNGGAISDFRIVNRVVSEAEIHLLNQWPAIQAALATDSAPLNNTSRGALLTYFLNSQYEPFRSLATEQNKQNEAAALIARRGTVSLVMQERTDAKPTAWILYRGAYDQRREQVGADTPAILPPMLSSMPKNRLGLAQWLFTADNPTTARLAVNRMWQEIFGIGLVKSTEDFGSQGETPLNQELLDWLAVDFRDHGWDVKRFYKQIVMSAAYRQAATVTPEKLEKDPDNRLLSRGPRFRLDGELIRDYALAASGLLSPQVGGPSVRPYQPDGVWEAVAMDGSNTRYYKHDQGDSLYRRSVYTFWKRSAPPASMEIFNAPTRESCTVRRDRTDTPLQALVTMNDVQFVEAARELAGRSMQASVDFDTRLDSIALRILARPLTIRERAIAKKSYSDFEHYYASHEDGAVKFLNQGDRKPDPALKPSEYAALAMLTSQLLNLDEVLNK